MAEIRDNFIKSLDDSDTGIGASMNRLMQLLKTIDSELYNDLVSKSNSYLSYITVMCMYRS